MPSFTPLPVPAKSFITVPEQVHTPFYEMGLLTDNWSLYLQKYPTGNPDDFQVAFNNSVIRQGNKASLDAEAHYIYQVQYYNQNKGSAGFWGSIPVPAPLPAQSSFYVAATRQNLTGPANVQPWKPSDAFGNK